jgi:allantoate deiminase
LAAIDIDTLTNQVLARCDVLGAISDNPTCLTRTLLSPATKRVHELLTGWMREAGLTVRLDAIGNLIGRKPGRTERVFAIGSHIDTVPDAGKYDGVLGVLIGLAALQSLKERPFHSTAELLAFSEEEGVRFHTPYLGSRAVCGRLAPDSLELTDANGINIRQAICDYGLDVAEIPRARYAIGQPVGYFEVHIEQGPVLDSLDASLGVVTAIVGQSRLAIRFVGRAGHAGTQPMELRRDALAAAAEFVCEVEGIARSTEGARATVGKFVVAPGAPNVVPGEVSLNLDVRHESDGVRRQIVDQLLRQCRDIAGRRQLSVSIEPTLDEAAVMCDPAMSERLAAAANIQHRLVSGAGHDAVVMATRCPVAMLFVRSPGGISHHPDESVRRDDVRTALDAVIRFLSIELNRE